MNIEPKQLTEDQLADIKQDHECGVDNGKTHLSVANNYNRHEQRGLLLGHVAWLQSQHNTAIEELTKLGNELIASSNELVKAEDRIADLKLELAEFRRQTDDPSKDPIGTVRQRPGGRYQSVRADWRSPDDNDMWPWMAVYPSGQIGGDSHETVKSWPIIGAVPGTPAAEAQQ